jgi:hypothetical protein
MTVARKLLRYPDRHAMASAYRTSPEPTYAAITRFSKAPLGPHRSQAMTMLVGAIVFGVAILGILVFTLVTSGPSGALLVMGLPLLGVAFVLVAVRGKGRAYDELWVEVSYCQQTGTVRFSSQPSRVVELPARDVLSVRHHVHALEPHQGFRSSLPRASFALVAETPQGDVELAVPMVCIGDAFISAARPHLEAELGEVTRRIAHVREEPVK